MVQQATKIGFALLHLPDNLPGFLGNSPTIRIAGNAGQVNATRAELNKEEHINSPQPHRLHGEEIARHELLFVMTYNLSPADGPIGAHRSGDEAIAGQDITNGGDGDSET